MSERSPAITTARGGSSLQATHTRHVTLLDLLDRLLGGGVVIRGQITLATADVDLVEIDLGLLVAAVETARGR